MVVGGVKLVSLSFLLGQTSAALGVPLGVVYLAMPASGVLIVFYFALFITERVRLLRGLPPALPVLQETTAEAYAENADPAQVGADETDLTRGGPAHPPDIIGSAPGPQTPTPDGVDRRRRPRRHLLLVPRAGRARRLQHRARRRCWRCC